MAYDRGVAPENPADFQKFVVDELAKIERNFNLPQNLFRLNPLSVAPSKPRRGDHYYADGTNWNPGSGEGTYRYNGTAYVFLG